MPKAHEPCIELTSGSPLQSRSVVHATSLPESRVASLPASSVEPELLLAPPLDDDDDVLASSSPSSSPGSVSPPHAAAHATTHPNNPAHTRKESLMQPGYAALHERQIR
jgi:hypothetical protein